MNYRLILTLACFLCLESKSTPGTDTGTQTEDLLERSARIISLSHIESASTIKRPQSAPPKLTHDKFPKVRRLTQIRKLTHKSPVHHMEALTECRSENVYPVSPQQEVESYEQYLRRSFPYSCGHMNF